MFSKRGKGYKTEKQEKVAEYVKGYCVGERPNLFHIGLKGTELFI